MPSDTRVPRPDLRWCASCGYNGRIECKETPIGTRWVCLTCSACGLLSDVIKPLPSEPLEGEPG